MSSDVEGRTLVVTGATGFLGRRVVSQARERGYQVRIVVRDKSQIDGQPNDIVVGDHTELVSAVARCNADAIVHIAATGGLTTGVEEYSSMIRSNITLGALMMEAAAASDDCSFVGIGSFAQRARLGETTAPTSFYGATKEALESFAEYYCNTRELSATFLLPTDIYGPGDPRRRLLCLLAEAFAHDEPIALTSGEQIVSFVHVDDVCGAILHCVRNPANVLDRYGVSGPQVATLRQTVCTIEEELDLVIPIQWGARAYRRGEVMIPDLLAAPSGWQPSRPVSEGFLELVQQHRRTP